MAIWLPRLAIDRWRLAEGLRPGEGSDAAPLALIAETAHGPRLAAVNDAARQAGVRPDMLLADARALCPELAVAPADPAGDRAALEALALWAQRWGPWSALDPPDGLVVDVTGVAHLFGGEATMLADAARCFAARGYAARPALAPTAGAAWALAHHGPERAILGSSPSSLRGGEADEAIQSVMHSRPGLLRSARNDEPEGMAVLDDLPVAALRLDPATVLVLRRLGLKRIGDLSGVAREALARRFRNHKAPAANPLIRLDQLLGRVPEPLLPVLPVDVPLVQRRLMEPIRHRSLLDRVLADLCADLTRVLEARALGARRLELALWKVDGEVLQRRLELAAASHDPAHIAALFGRKLDDLDAGFGIELARLRAPWTEPLALAQRDLEAAAEVHGTSLAACIDRLAIRLGPEAVRRPVPRASHVPERAQQWESLSSLTAGSGTGPLPSEVQENVRGTFSPKGPATQRNGMLGVAGWGSGPVPQALDGCRGRTQQESRPLKLLDRPEPIAVLYASPDGLPRRFRWRGAVHEIARAEGPERIAPEWWRERSTVRLRDYYRIEDGEGRRYWIYRSGLPDDGRGGAPEWFLQGLYA
jgi:protein ImuB